MAAGGIHDQLGGGFARYSVDAAWLVPHFEKMLYDNALLARSYLRGWQELGHERYRDVCTGILDWTLREMRGPEGGFYSALDADSEGEEGRFYTWTPAEARAALADAGLDTATTAVLAHLGISRAGPPRRAQRPPPARRASTPSRRPASTQARGGAAGGARGAGPARASTTSGSAPGTR